MRSLCALWMLCAAAGVQASVETRDWAFESQCSGAFSQSWGSTVAMDCAGDLSLSGQAPDTRLEAVNAITLRADGRLSLRDLTLVAPHIFLEAMHLDIQGGLVSPGGTIELVATGAPRQRPSLSNTPAAPGVVVLVNGSGVSLGAGAVLSVGGADPVPPIRASGSLVVLRPGSLTSMPVPSAGFVSLSPSVSPVPEPGSWALVLGGLLAVSASVRRSTN